MIPNGLLIYFLNNILIIKLLGFILLFKFKFENSIFEYTLKIDNLIFNITYLR